MPTQNARRRPERRRHDGWCGWRRNDDWRGGRAGGEQSAGTNVTRAPRPARGFRHGLRELDDRLLVRDVENPADDAGHREAIVVEVAVLDCDGGMARPASRLENITSPRPLLAGGQQPEEPGHVGIAAQAFLEAKQRHFELILERSADQVRATISGTVLPNRLPRKRARIVYSVKRLDAAGDEPGDEFLEQIDRDRRRQELHASGLARGGLDGCWHSASTNCAWKIAPALWPISVDLHLRAVLLPELHQLLDQERPPPCLGRNASSALRFMFSHIEKPRRTEGSLEQRDRRRR